MLRYATHEAQPPVDLPDDFDTQLEAVASARVIYLPFILLKVSWESAAVFRSFHLAARASRRQSYPKPGRGCRRMLLASTTAITQKWRSPSSVRVIWRRLPFSDQFLMVLGCAFANPAISEMVNKAGIWSIGQK